MKLAKKSLYLLVALLAAPAFATNTYFMVIKAEGVKKTVEAPIEQYENTLIDMESIYTNFYSSAQYFYSGTDKAKDFFGNYFSQSSGDLLIVSFDLTRPVALTGLKNSYTITTAPNDDKYGKKIELFIKNESGVYFLAKTLNLTSNVEDFIFDTPLPSTTGIKINMSQSVNPSYIAAVQVFFYEKTLVQK